MEDVKNHISYRDLQLYYRLKGKDNSRHFCSYSPYQYAGPPEGGEHYQINLNLKKNLFIFRLVLIGEEQPNGTLGVPKLVPPAPRSKEEWFQCYDTEIEIVAGDMPQAKIPICRLIAGIYRFEKPIVIPVRQYFYVLLNTKTPIEKPLWVCFEGISSEKWDLD